MGSVASFKKAQKAAQLERLWDKDSVSTKPEDLPRLLKDYLKHNPSSGLAIVIVENEEGGLNLLFAGTTLADAVFLLEGAKLELLINTRYIQEQHKGETK